MHYWTILGDAGRFRSESAAAQDQLFFFYETLFDASDLSALDKCYLYSERCRGKNLNVATVQFATGAHRTNIQYHSIAK